MFDLGLGLSFDNGKIVFAAEGRKPVHPSLQKAEHQTSRAARRGPMDEMRQLMRILAKLFPASTVLLPSDSSEGGGSGNGSGNGSGK